MCYVVEIDLGGTVINYTVMGENRRPADVYEL